MLKKPTKEEIDQRVLNSGVDAYTDDEYIRADIPMIFHCSYGHTWPAKLGNITHNHQGCPYCSGRLPIIGETDLWTTHPEISQLLLSPDDGYKFSSGSSKKKKFKCPICGAISEHVISNVVNRGFSCSSCGDGVSYPNKFAANMLNQLNVDYIPEFSFDDARYRYDFYVPQYSLIIEMHGRQHYEECNKTSRTLKEEQQNDKEKMDFALLKDIQHYIVVDARNSDINFISSHIMQTDLSNIFDLSNIDWRKCGYYASGSLVIISAESYNSGKTVQEIATELRCSCDAVRKYLAKATELNLCNWIKSKGFLNSEHQVVLVNTGEIFVSLSEASRKYNVPVANISKNCLKERQYAGIHPDTKEPMVWRYIEDYNPNEFIDFESLINPRAHYSNNTKLIKEVV